MAQTHTQHTRRETTLCETLTNERRLFFRWILAFCLRKFLNSALGKVFASQDTTRDGEK